MTDGWPLLSAEDLFMNRINGATFTGFSRLPVDPPSQASCINNPTGAPTAMCADAAYSCSTESGTCSSHGGDYTGQIGGSSRLRHATIAAHPPT